MVVVDLLELLKNSMIQINKTALNVHFNRAETDRELIFQQLYCKFWRYLCGNRYHERSVRKIDLEFSFLLIKREAFLLDLKFNK